MTKEKCLLDLAMDYEYSYKLSDRKEGEPFPIVSDVMFHTMLNNESMSLGNNMYPIYYLY